MGAGAHRGTAPPSKADRQRKACVIAVAGVLGGSAPALAQDLPVSAPNAAAQAYQPSLFSRDQDTPVAERTFRDLEAVGLPVGVFRLFPSLGLTALGTSNVYDDNRRSRGDGLGRVSPELMLAFDNSQVTADLYARGVIDNYVAHPSEDENQVTVGLDVRRNLPGYSYVFANASYGVLALPRLSPETPQNAAEPLRYEEGQLAFGGVYERDRVRLLARFDGDTLSYDDGLAIGGGLLTDHDRDRTRLTGTFQAEYAISPATAVYVGGSGNTLDYRLGPPHVATDRDSHGFEAFVGSNFELTGLMRADLRVGYLDQIFDKGAFSDISGLGVRGRLEYFPSRLTTVTVEARRSVESSGIPDTGGLLETGGSVSVDHEYRRYIMLNTKASYFNDEYTGIPRRDGILFFTGGATYLSRHNWNFKVAYEYYRQNSHGCDCSVNYDDHRLVGTLTFKY